MKISDFEFDLPRELIADAPVAEREGSRLLVLDSVSGAVAHHEFSDIAGFLRHGDVLVMNDTRVLRARLYGRREATGGRVEALLLEPHGDVPNRWLAMCRPAKRMRVGERVVFGEGANEFIGQVVDELEAGERVLEFEVADVLPLLDAAGELPLPPYIVQRRRELGLPELTAADDVRYQTVYADAPGSVAAPTAGLHFTERLLNEIRAAGVATATLTLHVGAGTFKPVECEDVADHKMHSERYSISPETVQKIREAKARGGRVVAVGTTTARTLEAATTPDGVLHAGAGSTDIMIVPGYKWRTVDALVTNFHLPRSTLLLLVSALSSREHIINAYAEAIARHYRFFSYGDAMLITRANTASCGA